MTLYLYHSLRGVHIRNSSSLHSVASEQIGLASPLLARQHPKLDASYNITDPSHRPRCIAIARQLHSYVQAGTRKLRHVGTCMSLLAGYIHASKLCPIASIGKKCWFSSSCATISYAHQRGASAAVTWRGPLQVMHRAVDASTFSAGQPPWRSSSSQHAQHPSDARHGA